jgi:hypothetical protein
VKQKKAFWETKNPNKKSTPLTPKQKAFAKSRAKKEPSYGRKKSVVYVSDGGKVKRVTFGDPNMTIKKNQPGRRSNFRARHNCADPGPKTKARYWSCKAW